MKTLLFLLTSLSINFQGRAAEADPYAPKPAVPPGYRLVHGDILEPEIQLQGAFHNNPNSYWPGGVVPYQFDANVSAVNRTAMLSAMTEWTKVATVQFVSRNGQADYVHIQNSTANNSHVGRTGGQQLINIVSWSSRFTIAHELGHCLGYWHTQSRPDRNSFVRINTQNIQADAQAVDNFRIESDILAYGPYDFDSIMHYGQCAFSIDCPSGSTCGCTHTTIDVLPPNETWQSRIGQRNHLSYWDKLVMSFLYPQPNWRFARDGGFSGNGTFLKPYTSLGQAEAEAPDGAVLWLEPGNYFAFGTHSKPMTLKAPQGAVKLVPEARVE